MFSGTAPSGAKCPSRASAPGRAARREADLLEQDRERDGEAVVDRRRSGCRRARRRPRRARGRQRAGAEGRERGARRVTCWCGCAWAAPRDAHARAAPSSSRSITKAAAPSETGQQSSSFSGAAIGFEASTSSTVMGSRMLRAGRAGGVGAHQHGELGEIGLRRAGSRACSARRRGRNRPGWSARAAPRRPGGRPGRASGWRCRATGR